MEKFLFFVFHVQSFYYSLQKSNKSFVLQNVYKKILYKSCTDFQLFIVVLFQKRQTAHFPVSIY